MSQLPFEDDSDLLHLEKELRQLSPADTQPIVLQELSGQLESAQSGDAPVTRPVAIPSATRSAPSLLKLLPYAAAAVVTFLASSVYQNYRAEQITANQSTAGSPSLLNQVQPPVKAANVGLIPINAYSIPLKTTPQGIIVTETDGPHLQLHQATEESYYLNNPSNGDTIKIVYPRDQIMSVPVEPF